MSDRDKEVLKTYIGMMRAHGYFEKLVKKDANQSDMNVTEFAVLELLYNRGPQPIQQIGNRILIASSSTTYVIDKLCNKGYVERKPDLNDRRVTFAEITAEGTKLMDEIYPEHRKHLLDVFEDFSTDEVLEMKRLLQKLTRYE
ncbi:MarR family winged helix-turn-helix transcriptional regulator [Facklamia sp. 7083-14-GEN3]|uniref:MarR family winged helix-turn-helix transcriptional regulator n=1 Tax=Facklamia sp. 7083-14-GEN3 TaxID=2973478 RepID=UPI00215B78B2|nr:MarR family transcriptional regulator [Facklamia sp. 7083-14-GEN3]MCR8969244.1 MarR family transcriptional regulator [Facklamia sp. 7083-14-GEN3]